MLPEFFRRHSRVVLGFLVLTFPFLFVTAESLTSNNDIETWLPGEAPARQIYDGFKERFGAEELILVGLPGEESDSAVDEQLVEAVCERIEALPEVRVCWSPYRLMSIMEDLGVDRDEARDRLEGLSATRGPDGLIGLAALLSSDGLADRVGTVNAVREELAYCQLEESRLAGAPVIVSELDRLGSRENNKQFFLVTLAVCLVLLYWTLRDWKLTGGILGLTIWSINLTLAVLSWSGTEMNFILGALPVMVMVFTLAISVHLVHYYRHALHGPDPLGTALGLAWKPCCLATLTTSIGLASLRVSDIGPVRQFGMAGALGAIVALVAGLGVVPALLTLFPPKPLGSAVNRLQNSRGNSLAARIVGNSRLLTVATLVLIVVAGVGVPWLQTRIDPIDFLPATGRVRQDARHVEQNLTSATTLEAVVDFGTQPMAFVDKLDKVRHIEEQIRRNEGVRHTMSLAQLFPQEMPDDSLETLSLLKRARGHRGGSDYIADGERLWRISVRLTDGSVESRQRVHDELVVATAGMPVEWTGISPLLDHAQGEIFSGFWESFLAAFVIITAVMIVSLRSLTTGVVAMVPNLTPILLVFGALGWAGWYVDIGMMMSGSIALGIAVDGTFHFLVRYRQLRKDQVASFESSREALELTGPPILQAAIVAAAGMLALSLSPFLPTMRFGLLTAAMLMTALLGDLVLLPSLLALPGSRRKDDDEDGSDETSRRRTRTPHGEQRPHFAVVEADADKADSTRKSGRSRGRGRSRQQSIPA
ncbi:MAG: MMPL family transporter [Planctomycetota bacterium]|nr:MMPL family transporter [Planctomycetota bacterium]